MASVQFYGLEKVIEAYENCQIPAWGLFSGKQLLCKYQGDSTSEGKQLLQDFCEKIERSTATYTLKVFEQEGKVMRIKENTPCDSSFNFKILEEQGYLELSREKGFMSGGFYGNKANSEILEKLNGIEQRLNEVEADEPDDDPNDIKNIMLDYLRNPAKLGALINSVKSLVSGEPLPMQAVGTLPAVNAGNEIAASDKLERLSAALDKLEKHDPLIVEHLEKLAQIAIDSPKTFRLLISNLNNF